MPTISQMTVFANAVPPQFRAKFEAGGIIFMTPHKLVHSFTKIAFRQLKNTLRLSQQERLKTLPKLDRLILTKIQTVFTQPPTFFSCFYFYFFLKNKAEPYVGCLRIPHPVRIRPA